MARPCVCDRLEHCRLCWLWRHDARYRQLWGGDPDEATGTAVYRPTPKKLPTCIHLGVALPNQPGVPCGARIRECDQWGACTLEAVSKTDHSCRDVSGRRATCFEADD